jgi:hypothetical protein
MKDLTLALKDRAIFAGWIAGLVLVAALLWSLTFSFRSTCLLRSTNKFFVSVGDNRRLAASLPRLSAGSVPLGCWYRLYESDSLFLVFSIMQEGILVPCGAEITANGEVVEVIPLGSHAQQIIDTIPRNLVQIYVRRIESAAVTAVAGTPAREGR